MQNRQPIKGSCASIGLPSATKFAQESKSLSEKLSQQVQWMQKRGISIKLRESERPSAEDRRPLPGTVLYFSEES